MSEERLEKRLGYRPPTPSERTATREASGGQDVNDQVLVAVDPVVQARFDRTMRKLFMTRSESVAPSRPKPER